MTPGKREVTVTAYPDGPLVVRGPAVFRNDAGEIIEQPRSTVALCRCGVSTIKPWCDGTHRIVKFSTADPSAS